MKTPRKFDDIVQHLRGFIEEHVCAPHEWYVGLATDAEENLFQYHKVDRQRDSWIYRMAENPEVAWSVQHYLLKLGCHGETRPKESAATMIYVYLKSDRNTP